MPEPVQKSWARDAAERVIATFIQALIASLIAADVMNVDAVKMAALSGIVPTLSLLKAIIAKYVGDPDSASLLPD